MWRYLKLNFFFEGKHEHANSMQMSWVPFYIRKQHSPTWFVAYDRRPGRNHAVYKLEIYLYYFFLIFFFLVIVLFD